MDAIQESVALFKALAHPERLRLLLALRESEECVCHLTALLAQRQPYVSQQLAYLREMGLISDHKKGLRVFYRIRDPRVLDLLDAVSAIQGQKQGRRAARRVLPGCTCPRCAATCRKGQGTRDR